LEIVALSILKAVELFRGLTETEVRKVDSLCSERRYPQGTTIFAKGDPADALYILKQGRVRLVALSEKGTETILHILKPDAVFGELLLSEEVRMFNAVAVTDVVVTAIPRRNLTELLETVSALAGNFIRLLSRRLAKVEKEFAEFGHTWSYNRLAKVLLQLGDEHGVKTAAGTLIPLRLTHEDLANLIGTTRETVTTQLNKFRKMGLVRREGRQIIVDAARLVRFMQDADSRVDGG